MSAEVVLRFSGSVKKESKLKIFDFQNMEQWRTIVEMSIENSSPIKLELDNEQAKYYTFNVNGQPWEFLILPNVLNELHFDYDDNFWKFKAGSPDARLFTASPKVHAYKYGFKDENELNEYHINFLKSIGLDSIGTNDMSIEQKLLNRICFNRYMEATKMLNLPRPSSKFNEGWNKTVKSWANLESIDISQANRQDFLTIRNFHIFFANEIFPYKGNSPGTFDEYISLLESWLDLQEYDDQLKDYIVGDVIQLFGSFQLRIDTIFIEKVKKYQQKSQNHFTLFDSILSKVAEEGEAPFEVMVKDVNENALVLKDFEQKLIYIDFWATWCKPCIEQEPNLKMLKAKFGNSIGFIKISVDEDKQRWRNYEAKKGLNFESYIFDSLAAKKQVAKKLGLNSIPQYLLVSNEGKIIDYNPPNPSDPIIGDYFKEKISEL